MSFTETRSAGCCGCGGLPSDQCWCGMDPPPSSFDMCFRIVTAVPFNWNGGTATTIVYKGTAFRYWGPDFGGGPGYGYTIHPDGGSEDQILIQDPAREDWGWTLNFDFSCWLGVWTVGNLIASYASVSDPEGESREYQATPTFESLDCDTFCFEFSYLGMPDTGGFSHGTADVTLKIGDCALPCTPSVSAVMPAVLGGVKSSSVGPCKYRLDVVREAPCVSCQGAKTVGVKGCEKFGECTDDLLKSTSGVKQCRFCSVPLEERLDFDRK